MTGERCRLTVAGQRRSVDVAIPVDIPIAEYTPLLATLCWQDDDEVLPAAWSLAGVDGRPVPPTSTIAEAGLVDGQTLYLCDTARAEIDGPIVRSVDELVAELESSSRQRRWDSGAWAVAAMAGGIAWLAATAGYAVFAAGQGASVLAILIGVALLAMTWISTRWTTVGPVPLRLGAAFGAAASFAAAGASLGSVGPAVVAAGIGANLALLVALTFVRHPALFVAEFFAAVAGVLAMILTAVRAGPDQAAGVVAAACLVLIAVAPRATAGVAASRTFQAASPSSEEVEQTVTNAHRLLAWATGVVAVVLVVCLVILSRSTSPFAWGLALAVVVALLCRLVTFEYVTDSIGIGLAAVVGLFCLVVQLSPRLGAGSWLGLIGAVIGLVLLATGVGVAVAVTPTRQQAQPRWLGTIGFASAVAVLPLLLGVFGVFSQLLTLSSHL